MNEGFRIRLRRNGRNWPIDSFGPDGIVLNNERDAFPRTVALEFDGRGDSTLYRMNRIRQLRGWSNYQFNLHATVVDGMLSFSGEDRNALPAGLYWVRLTISDLKTPNKRLLIEIEEGQSDAELAVDVQDDPRKVQLTTPFATFDAEIRRVLSAPTSILDGMPVDQWLASNNPRPTRKACLLNLMAKLRTAPDMASPLITDVRDVFFAGTERVYSQVNAGLYTRLQALANDAAKPFYAEGTPTSPMHLKLLDQVEKKGWGRRQDYALYSFRQEHRNSMQVVVAVPAVNSAPYCADFDIDLGNPLQDVEGFVVHMGELAQGGDTDSLELRDQLATGATKNVVYYTVG